MPLHTLVIDFMENFFENLTFYNGDFTLKAFNSVKKLQMAEIF